MVPAPALAEETLDTGAADDATTEMPAGDVAALADPEAKSPIPATCLHVPVTPPGAFDTFVTSGPGSGKVRSVLSIVVQPFPRLATNSDGREEKEVPARLPAC